MYLARLLDVLETLGLPTADVLRRAEIRRSALDDRDRSIPLSRYIDAVDFAVSHFDVPDLGFRVGAATRPLEHGVIGYAMVSSSHFGRSLERYVRYQYVLGPLLTVSLESTGKMAALSATPMAGRWRVGPQVHRYVVQEWLVGWNQWTGLIGVNGPFFQHVRLDYQPGKDARYYEEHLGCTVSFGNPQTTAIFPAAYLDRQLEYADDSIAALCSVQCGQLLETLNLNRGIVAEVHRRLAASPGRLPTMQRLADDLHMSARTLRRRLRDENTTYQQVVQDYRIVMAKRYLEETALPANEIAALVGYSDAANLYRTFHRATGQTPQQFRDAHSG